jgi:beta-catenin-like protein 1
MFFSLAELYKAAKLGANGDVKSKGKSAAVEDEEEDEGEAGPELPPDFEEDLPDDEEGRFFGGGMTKETTQAMEYLDQQDKDEGIAVSGKKQRERISR